MVWSLASLAFAGPLQDGVALRTAGDLPGAILAFERATEDDEGPEPWLELAVTRSWTGDLTGALAAYDQALVLDPDLASARVGRARVLSWSGRHARAERLLSVLEGSEARAELARVQLVRRKDRAARHTAQDLQGPGAEALTALRQSIRRTRLDVEGAWAPGGASSVSVAAAHEVSAETTVRATGRYGRVLDEPLSTATAVAGAGLTWARNGWWVSPGARWANGLWLEARSARRLGSVVVDGGVDLAITTDDWRLQAGATHRGAGWRLSGRGFLAPTSGAVLLEAATTGTWQVLLRGVSSHGARGDALTLGIGRAGQAFELHANVSAGTGVLAGPRAALRLGVRY